MKLKVSWCILVVSCYWS